MAQVGGITPLLSVAHTTGCFNLPVGPHFQLAEQVSLCAAEPSTGELEFDRLRDSVTTEQMPLQAGRAVLSSVRGLGIAWGCAAIMRAAER